MNQQLVQQGAADSNDQEDDPYVAVNPVGDVDSRRGPNPATGVGGDTQGVAKGVQDYSATNRKVLVLAS